LQAVKKGMVIIMKRKLLSFALALLLIVTLIPVNSVYAATKIPNGAVEYNGNYYYQYDQSATWKDAKANCEAVGGHLVTITSIEEEQAIFKVSSDHSESNWVGGLYKSNKWQWITGEAWEYTNWSYDYPHQGGEEDYLELSYYSTGTSWVNYSDNNNTRNYICEWEGNDISISLPNKVVLSSAKKASSTSVNVTWKEVKFAEGYCVYMKTSKDGKYKKLADIDEGDVTTYNKSRLKRGTTYYFRVRAYKTIFDEKSYGELSGEKKVTLK
jgi:hypothetical protein